MKTKQTGFTLVEIAIVLVIIGLLLGGILKGQEMIAQAKIKNVINDLNGVMAAMNSYQDRYRAIPGDDKGANARWTLTNEQGDGNGSIAGKYNTTTATEESALFWRHLRLAGFVSGTGWEQPFNAVSGKMGVQTGDSVLAAGAYGPVLATGTTVSGYTGLILCSANMPDKIAISVDSQTDDGNATTGSVRAGVGGGNIDVPPASSPYVEDGTKSYLVCRTLI